MDSAVVFSSLNHLRKSWWIRSLAIYEKKAPTYTEFCIVLWLMNYADDDSETSFCTVFCNSLILTVDVFGIVSAICLCWLTLMFPYSGYCYIFLDLLLLHFLLCSVFQFMSVLLEIKI